MRSLAHLPNQRLLRATAAAIVVILLLSRQQELAGLAPPRYVTYVQVALLVLAAIAGTVAIRNGVGLITGGLDRQAGMIIRNLSMWTLYALLAVAMASAVGFNLSGLLVGGAILGVIVAAGSQASLGNFFAGLVLMLGRPYRVGSSLRLRGPALAGGEYEGTVLDMGALYTTLTTPGGEVLKLPNSAVVTSALVLGEAPLQAEIDVALPPGAPLRPIEAAMRERLRNSAASVTIRPRVLEPGQDGKLACQVQVRSVTAVDLATVAEALEFAVAAAT